MFITFLIAFREALEAFLLVGILLGYLYRVGAGRYAKWIYMGVVAGLLASLVAAFLFQVVVDQFHNDLYRAYLTAGIMVVATLVLTYMAVWMQKQAKAHTAHATKQLEGYVAGDKVLGIALIAFVSVWREGLETVLFLSALAYGGEAPSLIGGAIGFVAAIAVVWLLMVGARKVPLQAFFRYTSLLLLVIAAGLLGSAVNMLQSAGIVPGSTTPLFDVSGVLSDQGGVGAFLRGLFGYNATPTAAQFLLWALYLAVAIALWRRGYAAKAKA
jgi:high-affinity iron transporter